MKKIQDDLNARKHAALSGITEQAANRAINILRNLGFETPGDARKKTEALMICPSISASLSNAAHPHLIGRIY